MIKNRSRPLNKQTGVVMVVSMIMLLLLTLIGLSGTQATSLEEKMASNAREKNIAFQAAESTLKEAERFILINPTGSATYTPNGVDATDGLLDIGDAEPVDYFALTWTAADSASTPVGFGGNFTNNNGVAIADPRYIIKKISQVGSVSSFRITARAQGINPTTQVILQEVFERTN